MIGDSDYHIEEWRLLEFPLGVLTAMIVVLSVICFPADYLSCAR